MFHEVYVYILAGVEPAACSEESAVVCLGLPELPKVPTTSKLSAAGLQTQATSTSVSPFILSEGLSPVPAKLVAKIQKGNYVDMAEFLCDNMEWERR